MKMQIIRASRDRVPSGGRYSLTRILEPLRPLAARYRGLAALCDQGVVSVTNFLTAMLIGRACGKAELGIYTLAWSILSLANGISATLITSPCIILGPHFTSSRRRRYWGSLAVHQATLSFAIALALSATAGVSVWGRWSSSGLTSALFSISLVIVFISLREFVRTVNFASLRTASVLAIDLAASFAQVGGMMVLLRLNALSASRTFAALGIVAAIVCVVWLGLHRHEVRLDPRLFLPDLKRNWAFARWLLGSAIAWQIATYFYPWMLAAFHGTSATGDWATCAAVVAAANPIFIGLTNYISPKIANEYASGGVTQMERYIYRCSLMFAGLLLPFVLATAGTGRYLIERIYGSSYDGATIVILLLALNMLVNSIVTPFAQGLFNLNCARADMVVNLINVVLLFTVGVPVVKFYGATGAAFALVGSNAILACVKIAIFKREAGRLRPAGSSAPPPSPTCPDVSDCSPVEAAAFGAITELSNAE